MKISKTHHVTKKGVVKKNPKKDDMFLLRKMLKFGGSAQDYPDSQIEGIILESGKKPNFRHQYYVDEKVRNIKRFLSNDIEAFAESMMIPSIRRDWEEFNKPTKVSDTKLLSNAYKFEDMNAGWFDENIKAILFATQGLLKNDDAWVDKRYVAEKVESFKRHLSVIDNFATRMMSTTAPQLRGEYLKMIGRKG